jgi:tetratricopeptide (TPR) repeat protein
MRVASPILLPLALMIAVSAGLAGCQKSPPSAPPQNDEFTAGQRALQKSDFKGAVADFNAALNTGGPVDARLFYDRGMANYNLQRYGPANADYSEALRRRALNHSELGITFVHAAYYYRGAARVCLGQWVDAKSDLLLAVQYYPKTWLDWDSLAYARYELGDYKRAVADYDRGMPYFKNDWNDHYNRALALYHAGDPKRAIVDFTAAIRHGSHVAGAYQNRGLAYSMRGDYKLADFDFSKAIKMIPKAWAWDYRCETRENLHRMADALYDCNHALAYYPRWAQAYIDRAYAKAMLGAEKGALADANSAVKYGPRVAEYYDYRGWIRGRMSQYRGAFIDYARAIRVDPTYRKARTDRQTLGTWILSAQHAGFTGFGIGALNVEQLENESAPSQSEYQKAVSTCGGYFSEGDSYFDDCVEKGVDEAKNDRSSDDEAEEQAEHDNYEVAQQVQEQENYQARQVEEANAAAEETANQSYTTESGGYTNEQPEESEQSEQEQPQESEPVSEPVEAPESSGGGE